MHEMLTGGELDYLTGDYLAELTMLILGRDRAKAPERGYAKTFLRQLEQCLGLAQDKGVRIVANAGGLNPAGLAHDVEHQCVGAIVGDHIQRVDTILGQIDRVPIEGQGTPQRLAHSTIVVDYKNSHRHQC
ncbi:Protein of uncharacterised function (DUF1446) [Mycobacteroides abscessus subsp. abscessus]|nr:Protein of uncharacterised function (DUF1446) [Mycobacteroides abscessus subsp. abscessus]